MPLETQFAIHESHSPQGLYCPEITFPTSYCKLEPNADAADPTVSKEPGALGMTFLFVMCDTILTEQKLMTSINSYCKRI